jgi:hypothetical protein
LTLPVDQGTQIVISTIITWCHHHLGLALSTYSIQASEKWGLECSLSYITWCALKFDGRS